MRVISCMILLVGVCTLQSGCSLFKKNTNGAPNTAVGGAAPAKFPGVQDPLLNSNVPQPPSFPATPPANGANPPTLPMSGGSSMLAGTVVDAFHRPVGNVYIRWINLEENGKDKGAPIDVAANANGHFIIQGLKPGASYKLIARTKMGEKMLAGTALTTAPNVRVLIPISEDRVNSSTPPLPNNSAPQGPADGVGAGKPAPKPGAEPNLPATLNVPAPPNNTPVGNPTPTAGEPAFVPGVVELPKDRLPMLTIPFHNTTPTPPPPTLNRNDSKLDTGKARVPSCVLVGSRLENLALKDSKGQTWEYRSKGASKLVLFDFWRTTCMPCRESMPAMNHLQQKFGSRGLEVIGVALEAGVDERREAEAVNKFCASMNVTYRQLMGRTGSFDVGENFKVQGVPTLILVGEQGDVIFHHVGRPDAATMRTLEGIIENHLQRR